MCKYVLVLTLFSLLCACAPATRVTQVSGDLYQITKEGGWGYDLVELKQEVRNQAREFADAAGKQCEIVDEKIIPDDHVDVYPADDDTYQVTFRLINRAPR